MISTGSPPITTKACLDGTFVINLSDKCRLALTYKTLNLFRTLLSNAAALNYAVTIPLYDPAPPYILFQHKYYDLLHPERDTKVKPNCTLTLVYSLTTTLLKIESVVEQKFLFFTRKKKVKVLDLRIPTHVLKHAIKNVEISSTN